MKSPNPVNFKAAGLKQPPTKEISASTMSKLRIFKDHAREAKIIVIFVGETTYDLAMLPLSTGGDFIKLAAEFVDSTIVLCHVDYEALPTLDQFAQIIGARIYALDDVPDTTMNPTQMIQFGAYRNRVSLDDYTLVMSGVDVPEAQQDAAEETVVDEDE